MSIPAGNGATSASGTGPALGYLLNLLWFNSLFMLISENNMNTCTYYVHTLSLIYIMKLILIFGIKIYQKLPRYLTVNARGRAGAPLALQDGRTSRTVAMHEAGLERRAGAAGREENRRRTWGRTEAPSRRRRAAKLDRGCTRTRGARSDRGTRMIRLVDGRQTCRDDVAGERN
jgi:hypothetical protein